ncbi:MAG: hypothetical protein QXQ02_00255 [Halobacteria archaeon]
MSCCLDPKIIEAIDNLKAAFLGLYPIDDCTLLIQRKMSALEKLRTIPIGRHIKLSDCNTFDVSYFIYRQAENSYMVARKMPVEIPQREREKLLEGVKKSNWEFCDRIGNWKAGFEAYIWLKKENLRAEEVLEIVHPHNIIAHELYEFKTDISLKSLKC